MALTEEVQGKFIVDRDKISKGCDQGFIYSSIKDAAAKKSLAKSNLHELCTKQHWKQPSFQCCKVEGPDHQKLFTFMVSVDVQEALTMLECYGNPRANKKAAAENAAEGALWCLKHMGYQLTKK